MTTNKIKNIMKELTYNIGVGCIIEMNQAILKEEDYTEHYNKMISLMIKEEKLQGLYFNEFWAIGYNCLYIMIEQAEIREEYEVCSSIQTIITNEEEMYVSWCLSLPDEEQQQDALDELDYIRIAIKMQRDGR
jgi:hypothetical protein